MLSKVVFNSLQIGFWGAEQLSEVITNFDCKKRSERDKFKLYSTCMQNFTGKIVKSAATPTSIYTTKATQK